MNQSVDTRSLGPGAQATRMAFWFVAAIAVLAALAWATSNVRRIPADSRAVVQRFGAFARTQEAGLTFAWPRPFETVLLVPGSARVLEQRIASLERDPRAHAADLAGAANPSEMPALSDALAGSGYVLTGDNGVVHLSATLYYRVVDPVAYVLQAANLKPAIERAVAAAVVEVAAARDLDAILVARPELLASDARLAAQRERLRGDIAQAAQRHFDALAAAHAALGIEVARVDVQASFPAAAVGAFDSVLSASQTAERAIADARTAAETTRQSAQQSADQILRSANASAAERVATAQAEATTILQLESALDAHSDPGLLARAYRERMQQILSKAGRVTTIDPHDVSALVLPGKIR
ncbi:MAG TPA: SPFH domain-containing protein [Trinickia sp.]|nr:SPFH domain-containing protein [Trinickia sp.]